MAQDLMRGLAEKPRTNQHHSWDVDPWAGYRVRESPRCAPSEIFLPTSAVLGRDRRRHRQSL